MLADSWLTMGGDAAILGSWCICDILLCCFRFGVKMNVRVFHWASFLILLQCGSVFGSSYGTLQLDITSSSPNIRLRLTGALDPTPNNGRPFRPTYRGDYDGFVDSVDAVAASFGFDQLVGQNVEMYCVELDQGINDSSNVVFEIVDLEDLSQISPIEAIRIRQLVTVAGTIGATDLKKSEEQAAIWEIVHDDGALDLSAGDYQVRSIGGTTSSRDNAQALLDAITTNTAEASVFGLYNAHTQDYGVLVVGGGEEVPEPAMVVNVLGLVLAGTIISLTRWQPRTLADV